MTEAEWLTCTDPRKMLEFLRGKASTRKLRMFAVACCRRVWQLQKDERCQQAIDVTERLADGAADEQDRLQALRDVTTLLHELSSSADDVAAVRACHKLVWTSGSMPQFLYLVSGVAEEVARAVRYEAFRRATASGGKHISPNVGAPERAAQAALLGEVFGNPFRPVMADSAWLSWNEGTVVKLANSIYSDRTFDCLPILADALEEAGCHDADILAHCRGPGPHVLGCYVLDALLGKT
jgi:hypothetical protein